VVSLVLLMSVVLLRFERCDDNGKSSSGNTANMSAIVLWGFVDLLSLRGSAL
jgi:hypothetical protein